MVKPIPGGYLMRQELTRARNANRACYAALRRLIDEPSYEGRRPLSQVEALLIARAGMALGENLAALGEIERICNGTVQTEAKGLED